MFVHEPIEFYTEPEVREADIGRVYDFGQQKYPSITTILGKTKDDSGLKAWKLRVGEEEANRISKLATKHGSELHLILEDFINGNEISAVSFKTRQVFQLLRPIISKRITTIYGIECPLRSDSLRIAGRTDLVADLDGVPTVIDWKTSKEPGRKEKEHVEDYYLQGSFYGRAINESGKMEIKQGALVFCNPFGIFIDKFVLSDYNKPLEDRVKEYYAKHTGL